LAAALRNLRSERRPDSALAALDDYLSRFPKGVLHPEAMRLRTEALLMLGRKHAALDELDRQSFDGTTGGEERRLLRGELRAAAGRWRAAFEDFDAVVRVRLAREGASLAGETRLNERIERALWGRASARSHFGDDAGARTDLREYLRHFPQGRFASQATHLLGELR
jgi:TolA-binding protein